MIITPSVVSGVSGVSTTHAHNPVSSLPPRHATITASAVRVVSGAHVRMIFHAPRHERARDAVTREGPGGFVERLVERKALRDALCLRDALHAAHASDEAPAVERAAAERCRAAAGHHRYARPPRLSANGRFRGLELLVLPLQHLSAGKELRDPPLRPVETVSPDLTLRQGPRHQIERPSARSPHGGRTTRHRRAATRPGTPNLRTLDTPLICRLLP